MVNFPKEVTLVDTGLRRYPLVGEVYCFEHPISGLMGPFTYDDEADSLNDGWIGDPEDYAIYTTKEKATDD